MHFSSSMWSAARHATVAALWTHVPESTTLQAKMCLAGGPESAVLCNIAKLMQVRDCRASTQLCCVLRITACQAAVYRMCSHRIPPVLRGPWRGSSDKAISPKGMSSVRLAASFLAA